MSSHAERWYRKLASARGAAVATLVVVAATAVAVALSTLTEQPATGVGARLSQIFEAGDPFRSWWYALALIFGAVTALAWLLESGAILRAGPTVFPIKLRATSRAQVSPKLVRALLAAHGRVREGDGGLLMVRRGTLRRGAPLVAAAGALLACGGGLLGAALGWSGVAHVPDGGTVYSYLRRSGAGPVRTDLGAELQIRRQDGGLQRPRWTVELARGAAVLARAELGLGDSFEAGGRRFRLRGAGPGQEPAQFLLGIDGKKPRALAAAQPVRAGTTSVAVVGYEANLAGRYGPAARVTWIRPGSRPETGWVLGRYPDFDARVRRSRPPLRLAGVVRRLELKVDVEHSSGGWLVYLGGLAFLCGLLFFASPPYARLQVGPVAGGWRVEAVAERNTDQLADEVDELLARLEAAGRQASPTAGEPG